MQNMATSTKMLMLMGMLVGSLVPALHATTASSDCLSASGTDASSGSVTPSCYLDVEAGGDVPSPRLILTIRVLGAADCAPASGADITVAGIDGRKCSGVTSESGDYVTGVSLVGQEKWKIVSVVATQGEAEVKAHVYVQYNAARDKVLVKTRDSRRRVSVVEITAASDGNYSAVVSLALEEGAATVVGKRSWDDESMAWLKRMDSHWGEDMSWIKRSQLLSNNKVKSAMTSHHDRRKRWDDDNMQWIKRWHDDVDMAWLKRSSPLDNDVTADNARDWTILEEKRKSTQNTHGLRDRQGARGRSRFH